MWYFSELCPIFRQQITFEEKMQVHWTELKYIELKYIASAHRLRCQYTEMQKACVQATLLNIDCRVNAQINSLYLL
jgi:hypothetical protein